MSKAPSPRADNLRAMREARYDRAQAAMKADKPKPAGKRKVKSSTVRTGYSQSVRDGAG